jgi:protein CpxP
MAGLSGRRIAAVVLISTLATGVLSGVVLERFVLSDRPGSQIGPGTGATDGTRRPPGPRGRSRRERSAAGLNRQSAEMSRQLGLTPEQRVRVDSIMARGAPRLDALQDETRVRMDSVFDGIRTELSEVLTPEQRSRLDDVLRPPRRDTRPPR